MFKQKTFAICVSTLIFMLSSLQVAAQSKEKVENGQGKPETVQDKSGSGQDKAENVIDDTLITTKVKAKLLADPIVSSLNISVETTKGVVALTGNLRTEAEVSAAVQDAHSIPGVTDVDSAGLKAEAMNHPIADIVATAKVKGIYIREKLFGDKEVPIMSIHVETKDGVVYLSGEAESTIQAENAKTLAETVKGVTKVESTVTVKK